MTENDGKTTAEMIDKAYAELGKLYALEESIREKVLYKIRRNHDAVLAFSKEEDDWERWTRNASRLYREAHREGTIYNVLSIEFRCELFRSRIKMLESWFLSDV